MKDMEELILKDLSPLEKDLRNENIYKIKIYGFQRKKTNIS